MPPCDSTLGTYPQSPLYWREGLQLRHSSVNITMRAHANVHGPLYMDLYTQASAHRPVHTGL
eukprot:232758-Chlamydomonas_euryale.AAC.1